MTNDEYNVQLKGVEGEEKDEKLLVEGSSDDTTTANDNDKASPAGTSEFSTVNMAGVVQPSMKNLNASTHSKRSQFSNTQSSKSFSHSSQSLQSASNDSVWESDLNDEDEGEDGAFGQDDDDDFYGLNNQNGQQRYEQQQQLNNIHNPHIEEEYPIPHPSTLSQAQQQYVGQGKMPSVAKLNPEKPGSHPSAGSLSSGSNTRRSRRGSLRVPGDETSNKTPDETEEELRKRAFQERLERLERRSSNGSKNQHQQQPKTSSCKCTKDLIPVAASLLLLAVGIAVAIYLLVGPNSGDDGDVAPTQAPTGASTPRPTFDPNPFRQRSLLRRGYDEP